MTQDSLFGTALVARPAIELQEDASDSYVPRTKENAHRGDITLAIALDYDSAGERLTKKAAGPRYIAIPFNSQLEPAQHQLIAFARKLRARSINVAGNGLYTFKKFNVTQDAVNGYVYRLLAGVHREHPIEHIRSGGQTGTDWAGLVAGIALGIPVTGLFPKGYRQRNASGQEFYKAQSDVLRWLHQSVSRIACNSFQQRMS